MDRSKIVGRDVQITADVGEWRVKGYTPIVTKTDEETGHAYRYLIMTVLKGFETRAEAKVWCDMNGFHVRSYKWLYNKYKDYTITQQQKEWVQSDPGEEF